MKVIIDTNVAIDIMQGREGFVDDASTVMLFCCTDRVNAFFTTTTITTIYYILHQYFHDGNYVKQVMSSWDFVVDTIAVSPEDCHNALYSEVKDYEDAVMAECAKREDVSYIITRNTKDFVNSPVKAVTPSEFITLFLRN